MPARKKPVFNSNFCSQEDNEKLKEEFQQQIDIENLMKFLLKQELINAGDKRKVDSKTLIAAIKEKGFSKLKTNEEELQQWLHSNGYVDVIGFHSVTFNQEKIKNLQDTRFANLVESEMEKLLMILVADGLITEDNLFLNKEELRRYLLKNRNHFPHVTQSDLGHNMLARSFVETKTTGDFELSKKKLKAMIQRREAAIESAGIAEATVRAKLEQGIGLLINSDLLTQSNLVIVRRKMREFLQVYGLVTPPEFYDVGYNLKKFGYLEQKPKNLATAFVFQLEKIKHLVEKRIQTPKQEESPEMLCPSKHERLKQLVRRMVEKGMLARGQYVVKKDQLKLFLREFESEFPGATFKNVGADLKAFGFLQQSEDCAGQTYQFVPTTIDAIIRIKEAGFKGSQQSLVSQESQSSVNSNAALSAEQLKYLIVHLVRGGHLARNKNFVEKTVVVDIVQSNTSLFSTLNELNIAKKLVKGGYLEYQLSPSIFNFHMNKIMPAIESNERDPMPLPSVVSKAKTPVKTMMKKAKSLAELNANQTKQEQIELYFEYMVRENFLTVEDNVVDRSVINNALHSEASDAWPILKTANIGHMLMTSGYLDFQITPGTYNFRKEKISSVLDKIETETVDNAFEKMRINTNVVKQPPAPASSLISNLTDKEQADLLVKLLVKENVLTMFNTIVKKTSVRDVLTKNKHHFPTLCDSSEDQDYLSYKLREFGFLDHQVTAGTFNFHKDRIEHLFAESDESENSSDPENEAIVDAVHKVEKTRELNQLVHMLIDQKHLSETKRVVTKDVARSVFLSNLENWRYAAFKELGYILFTCGFIESESVSLGSFLFTEKKIQEILAERKSKDDPPKPAKNIPDQETDFPQLGKAPIKLPDVSVPPPQKSVAPVIRQMTVPSNPANPIVPVPVQFQPQNIMQSQQQQTLLQQLFFQQQNLMQQNLLQQNQFQQNPMLQNPYQQTAFQQNLLQQNMQFPNMLQPNQFNQNLLLQQQRMQNLAAAQCLVPQHFAPEHTDVLGLDDFSSWKISRIVTFARPKGEPLLGAKSCYVCRESFRMLIHFQEHMDTVHGAEFEIPLEVTMGRLVPVVFEMQLIQKGGRASNLSFKLFTKSGKIVTINKIFYIYHSRFYALVFKPTVAMVPTYEFEINREFFVTDDEQHSIVVFFEDSREYIEHFVIMTPKPLVNIDNSIAMAASMPDLQQSLLGHPVFK